MPIQPIFRAAAVMLALSACKTTYVRHSGLHHIDAYSEIVLNGKNTNGRFVVRSNDTGRKLRDTAFVFTRGTNFTLPDSADTQLYVIENGDVIWYLNAYWLKKGAHKPEYDQYTHNDVRF